jgi:hypothetical protein
MSQEKMCEILMLSFGDNDRIYSYIVYFTQKDERESYTVKYMISQSDCNNTIDTVEATAEILMIINKDKQEKKRIIGYRQAHLDKLIELMQPLVHRLARTQQHRWQHLEYEDLCQMCNMAIVELYNKGYYVHKSLVEKTFNNMVLMELRHERDKPAIVPLEQAFNGTEDLEKLTIADIIADPDDELRREREELTNAREWTFQEVREIIVELIGPRQFDQLFRDYGNKHTTAASRKLMQKVKNHFANLGLTKKEFDNKYYGKN